MIKNNKISIIGGAGHIGLPLAVKFAEKNYYVNLVDSNIKNLIKIKRNDPPFKEINLKKDLGKQLKRKRFFFSEKINSIIDSKFVIICIGTPISNNLKPDLKNFYKLINELKNYLKKDQYIIIRSSVLPGTAQKVCNILQAICKNISYCPERIVEGNSLIELAMIPQIISGSNKNTIQQNKNLFSKITKKIIICNFMEAELSKIFSNLYRYINFAIPNEMYLISRKLNADFSKIREIMRDSYPRNFGLAKAGFVGGPCLMKDSMQISYLYKNKKSLVNSAYALNENLPNILISELKKIKNIKRKNIGILGLTFKAESDDVRGSLAIKLIKLLKKIN